MNQILDGLDWRKIPRFSDEQLAEIRSAGGSTPGSDFDRKREKQQLQWLKSKNLQ